MSDLFEEAINLQWTPSTGLIQLQQYILKNQKALEEDTVGQLFSNEFCVLAKNKMLVSMLLHQDFKNISTSDENLIKTIYCEGYTGKMTEDFIEFLRRVSAWQENDSDLDSEISKYKPHDQALLLAVLQKKVPFSQEAKKLYQSIQAADSKLQLDPSKIQDFLAQQLVIKKDIAHSFEEKSINASQAYALEAYLYSCTTAALGKRGEKYEIAKIQPTIKQLYRKCYSSEEITQLITHLTTIYKNTPTSPPGSATSQDAILASMNNQAYLSAMKYIHCWPAPSMKWLLITNGSHYTSPLTLPDYSRA